MSVRLAAFARRWTDQPHSSFRPSTSSNPPSDLNRSLGILMHPGTMYIALISLCLLVKLGCVGLSSIRIPITPITVSFSLFLDAFTYTGAGVAYVGTDYPRPWDIGVLLPVLMNIEPTKHYSALRRWPFSISLFHQLRCLDVIRHDIIEALPQEESELSRHCLNYMRQMALCRTDLAVDPVLGRELEAEVCAETNRSQGDERAGGNIAPEPIHHLNKLLLSALG
ncbi:hypothetical protein EDB87DRAFT_1744281 [Lactarius vividus]|nr:hypothetical protein EDB87DRAFT_1744281 [Lactarius vividus]